MGSGGRGKVGGLVGGAVLGCLPSVRHVSEPPSNRSGIDRRGSPRSGRARSKTIRRTAARTHRHDDGVTRPARPSREGRTDASSTTIPESSRSSARRERNAPSGRCRSDRPSRALRGGGLDASRQSPREPGVGAEVLACSPDSRAFAGTGVRIRCDRIVDRQIPRAPSRTASAKEPRPATPLNHDTNQRPS